MTTNGVTLINTQGSSTMYALATTVGSTPGSPTNMSLSAIQQTDMSASPQQFTYDSSNPLTPNNSTTSPNSVTLNTSGTTYVYVWINTNPSTNTNASSDVVTTFTSTGLMMNSTSTSTTAAAGPIIQYTGNSANNANQYYVYTKSNLMVVNNSSSTIAIQTVVNSNNTIPGISNGTCPTTQSGYPTSTTGTPGTSSGVQNITASSSGSINSAFPTASNGAIYTTMWVWKGTNIAAGTAADYGLVFRPVDFTANQDCNASTRTLLASWNASSMTVTFTDAPSGDTGGLPNGSPCLVPSDCSSGVCTNGTCTAKDSGGGGFPWWGWLIIAIVAIIIIGLLIWVFTRSRGSNEASVETKVE